MIYLFVFFTTAIFARLADKSDKKKRKFSRNVFLILTAALPILLGSLRNVLVGTDNLNYAMRFQWAGEKTAFFDALTMGDFDAGFNALMWFVSRFTDNYNWFCFLITALTFVCLISAFWKLRENISFPVAMLSYLFIYNCSMYNLFRQSLALAMCMLALSLLFEKKQSAILFL